MTFMRLKLSAAAQDATEAVHVTWQERSESPSSSLELDVSGAASTVVFSKVGCTFSVDLASLGQLFFGMRLRNLCASNRGRLRTAVKIWKQREGQMFGYSYASCATINLQQGSAARFFFQKRLLGAGSLV